MPCPGQFQRLRHQAALFQYLRAQWVAVCYWDTRYRARDHQYPISLMIIGWHMPCFNQCVRKTELFARLLHLSMTGKGICAITSLLILAAAPVRAGGPVMTLVMNQPTGGKPTASTVYSGPETGSLFFNLISSQPEAVNPDKVKAVAWASGIPSENQTNNSFQRESFLLIREDSHSHSNRPVTVRAGYGQIWDDKSTLQKISAGQQEPGFAYVSARFSF
jgi:hypothetical protein